MGNGLEGLLRWASSVTWRDAFDESIDWHLGAADEFDLAEGELEDLLGDRMETLVAFAFEDLASAPPEAGLNLVDDYLKRRGWKESASDRAFMAGLRDSVVSIYEAGDVVPGVSLMARDLVRGGDPVLVSERTATRTIKAGDHLALRLVDHLGKLVMTGAPLVLSPAASERALADLEQVRQRLAADPLGKGLADGMFGASLLKSGAPIISGAWLRELLDRVAGDRRLPPGDDDFELLYVRYPFSRGTTPARLRAALARVPGIRLEDRDYWTWTDAPADGAPPADPFDEDELFIGELAIEGRSLTVLVASRELADLVIGRLAAPLAGLVGEPAIDAAEGDDDAGFDDDDGDRFPATAEPGAVAEPGAGTAFGSAHAASYAEGPPRQVPGFAALHRMTSMLLAERVPAEGHVLVVGAGGGLELAALAGDHPGWRFDGVDPSADMLRLAAEITAPHAARIQLHQGYVASAPEGPFDGATCLLVLHFVPREQRLATLTEIRRRLAPGAPLVVAHVSFSQAEPERSQWIARHVAFGDTDPANAESARQAIGTRLSILSPADEEAMLAEAGFTGISLFYAGLSFRGWVAYA